MKSVKLLRAHPYIKYIAAVILFMIIIWLDTHIQFFTSRSISLMIRVIYFGIVALGFNFLLGYGGQISLGHAAFMGLGAYLTAYLTNHYALNFILVLFISGFIPMIFGGLLGLVALRLERLYLAIATLGLGVTIQQIFQEWDTFTGGFSGVRVPRPEMFGYVFIHSHHFLLLISVILLVVMLLSYNFARSRTGRALKAMRDSEYAARSLGINLVKYKLLAFAACSFYVGIAGSLYAYAERFVHPQTWGVELSLDMLAMVVIGGLASIPGSMFGAAFLVLIPQISRNVPLLRGITNINFILTGLAMILVIKFMPMGIYNWLDLKLIQPLLRRQVEIEQRHKGLEEDGHGHS